MSVQEKPLFCSMGMLIIDEIRYPSGSGKTPIKDIIGGGGTFAILGARIVAGRQNAHLITGVIDEGNDFPDHVKQKLENWNCGLKFRKDEKRKTTRGENVYDEHGTRHFYYQTPKKRIEAVDILSDSYLRQSRTFHIISSISRCHEIIDSINSVNDDVKPLFIYEPLPDICEESNFGDLTALLPKIDVFSPNLQEAAAFVGLDTPQTFSEVKGIAARFSPYLTKPNSGSIVRCGALGCYLKTPRAEYSFPAYHSDPKYIVDETGCGNLFCGAFVTSLLVYAGDWKIAAIIANVISGCVIENLGMPVLEFSGDQEERWNGKSFRNRLHDYRTKYALIFDNDPTVSEFEQKILEIYLPKSLA